MLRELKSKDVFKMSKILKKMNLKINADEAKTQKQVGAELILSVFENLHLAEFEVNEFLADMAGIKIEEFEELPFEKTMEIVKEFKNIAGLSSFLKQANQSTK
jgi:hypothetical protein